MKIYTVAILLSALYLGGCATANTGYYWENYSGTLYSYKQNPTPENRAKHINELRKIIKKAESKSSRVPPGVHAELGYMLAVDGDKVGEAQSSEKKRALIRNQKPLLKEFI